MEGSPLFAPPAASTPPESSDLFADMNSFSLKILPCGKRDRLPWSTALDALPERKVKDRAGNSMHLEVMASLVVYGEGLMIS